MSTSTSTLSRKPSTISFRTISENSCASYHLIFFITGNPGLISYYDTFLSTLHQLLSDTSTKSDSGAFHIYGQSLAGFEQDDKLSPMTSAPWSLEDQIEILLQSVNNQTLPSGPRQGQSYDSVIFIGHSVGTYIIMEILNRLRKSSSPLKVKGAILLFPTVTHLAKSPSGIRFSSFFRIPGFPRGLSMVANTLLWPFPRPALKHLVGLVTGMPEGGAEITTRFLTSSMGIWQALHMAKDELESITEDKWDEDIWGIEHDDGESRREIPKLIFYFGEHDHWVSNHIRDELIAARGKGEGESSSKPLMMIDDNEVPHSFCIEHSEQIAEKAKLWIDDILEN